MVERVRPGVLDQGRSCSCHNWHRIARASVLTHRGHVRYAPRHDGCDSEVLHIRNQGAPLSLSRRFGQECSPSQWRFIAAVRHVPRRWPWRPRTRASEGPPGPASSEKTLRRDRWWLYPLTTFVVFMSFIVYATLRAFPGSHYYSAPYLSPFYSPCLGDCVEGSSDFGQPFAWWPLSPALIILIFPLGFRLTCYYYRKAYYRSFWLSPPACAVAEPHGTYTGETRLPLILNNIHRYFWYAAVRGRADPQLRRGAHLPRRGRRLGPHGPRHRWSCWSTSC